jgi:hypothetical protein
VQVVGLLQQHLDPPDGNTYLGSGKITELLTKVEATGADPTPAQKSIKAVGRQRKAVRPNSADPGHIQDTRALERRAASGEAAPGHSVPLSA